MQFKKLWYFSWLSCLEIVRMLCHRRMVGQDRQVTWPRCPGRRRVAVRDRPPTPPVRSEGASEQNRKLSEIFRINHNITTSNVTENIDNTNKIDEVSEDITRIYNDDIDINRRRTRRVGSDGETEFLLVQYW